MNQLTISKKDGILLVDSLEVAKMTNVRHGDLLEKIEGYIKYLLNGKLRSVDFFILHTYRDSTGRTLPRYFLTKKGCDMIANKMTGEKGVLFTAAYVTKFEEMEKQTQPQSQLEILQASINQLVEQEQKVKQIETQLTTVNHRLDNIDRIDTIGDLRQRLNAMVKRYAHQEGLTFSTAWKEFRNAFNTAYHTNLTNRVNHYKDKHGLKSLSIPLYLSLSNNLEDAIRVADKMLNQDRKE